MTIASSQTALCTNNPPVLQSTQVGTKIVSYSGSAGDEEDVADISDIFDLDASFID